MHIYYNLNVIIKVDHLVQTSIIINIHFNYIHSLNYVNIYLFLLIYYFFFTYLLLAINWPKFGSPNHLLNFFTFLSSIKTQFSHIFWKRACVVSFPRVCQGLEWAPVSGQADVVRGGRFHLRSEFCAFSLKPMQNNQY